MFTGIVGVKGEVISRSPGRLVVKPRKMFKDLREGESVSVDGVCLTVDRQSPSGIRFRLLPETLRATTMGSLKPGSSVNLERSLRLGDRLGGHLLLGHVDGQGTVLHRRREGKSQTLDIEVPSGLAHALVPKGPVGIDGVSLTLGPEIFGNRVRVHLIPFTLSATSLGVKPVGSRVNVEVDLIAKYLWRML